MKKNLFSFLLLLLVFFCFNIINVKAVESEDVELSITPRTWQGHNLVLELTNNSEETITISGDILVKRLDNYQGDYQLDQTVDVFYFDETTPLEIAPSETEKVAEIVPGNPMSWRNFYHSNPSFNITLTIDDAAITINNVSTTIIYEVHHLTREPFELVYFSDEDFSFSITDLPRGKDGDGYTNELGTNFTSGKLYFVLYEPGKPGATPIDAIEGLQEDEEGFYYELDEIIDGEIEISEKIKADLPFGHIGYYLVLDDEELGSIKTSEKPFGAVDWRNEYNSVFVWVGFREPEIIGMDLSGFRTLNNWYETEKELPFTKTGVGSIIFDSGLNIIESADQLEQLQNAMDITYNSDNKQLKAKVDTTVLTFLSGHGATIQFFDVAKNLGLESITSDNFLNYIDFTVIDNDEEVIDISDYFDLENVVYNAKDDILSIPVNHFTEYIVSLKHEVPIPKTGINGISILFIGFISSLGLILINQKEIKKSFIKIR